MKLSEITDHCESTGLLFWQVSMLWQRKIRDVLQPYMLTHTQFVILAVIEELGELSDCITQKNISDFSMIDVMTVSSTIRLLEKKGLVCRLPHKTDSRAYAVCNTREGHELLAQAVKTVDAADREFFFDTQMQNISFRQELSELMQKALARNL